MRKTTRAKRVRTGGKGEATRQRVIEQAAPVLNKKGFAGTTLSDLMEATGLRKGGIYRHFADKEALALETMRHMLAAAERVKFDDLDPAVEGIDRLKLFVSNFVTRSSPVAGGCPMLNASVEHDDGNSTFRREAGRTALRWISRLADIVRQGQKARTVSPAADAPFVALIILSSLEGALAINRLAPETRALPQVERFLHQLLENYRV